MHTKSLVVVSVMVLLGILALFAICARFSDTVTMVETGTVESSDAVANATGTTVAVSQADVTEDVADATIERRALSPSEESVVVSSQKFQGVLEEVNVGCFADGECYVVVDGKHITTMIGWTNATVGSIKGVTGFGDLEGFIGEVVEVYAGVKTDGTYTLYENADYYIALRDVVLVMASLGQMTEANGVKITPKKILEDNRCPVGVMCIQAGTLVLETEVQFAGETKTLKTELGEEVKVGDRTIKLLRAEPLPEVGSPASNEFYFGVWK